MKEDEDEDEDKDEDNESRGKREEGGQSVRRRQGVCKVRSLYTKLIIAKFTVFRKKWLRMDGPTDEPTDRQTHSLIDASKKRYGYDKCRHSFQPIKWGGD